MSSSFTKSNEHAHDSFITIKKYILMKKNIKYLCLLLLLAASCKKEEVLTPEFEVTADRTTVKVGDYVTFGFTGNPDLITFYPGINGQKYENANRFTAIGIPKLQFSSARNAGVQPNSLQVMVSSDFIGKGADEAATAANIAKATWTDITSRAVLSGSTATVASGGIDLSDIAANDKPVFIAFKYSATAGTIQNKWTISALTVTNTLPDATLYTIANLNITAIANYGVSTIFSPGWVQAKVTNTFPWVITAGSSLVVTGAATAALSTAASEAWTFSGPINLRKVSNDIGISVKEASARLDRYSYAFTAAGTYKVSFVAANSNFTGAQETVRSITITVTP
jgi:hypothetical protein